ncbi:MAG: hypothetical protein LC624_10405 [Halobacteriales archaeon]|nr:hypothetical protein [Halobacteriales archaeon]
MDVKRFQEELAALLMEERARRSFAKDAKAHARKAGLKGKEARILAALDAGDVGYFASRREIDRRGMLRADLPQTCERLDEENRVLRYFRAHPYALEDPLAEAERVARWARQAARKGQVSVLLADTALFEATLLRARTASPKPARPSARPRRAPGLKLLRLAHDLSDGAERPCHVAIAHGPHGVEAGEVDALAWHVLRAADGKRTSTQVAALAARQAAAPASKARTTLRRLAREGFLAPLA